jgi:hypothetical protein
MSVLKLRRDMVVVEDERETDTVSESDRPFPLRKLDVESEDIVEGHIAEPEDDTDDHVHIDPPKTFFQHVRFWFNATAIVALLGAYPALTVAASDVGDRDFENLINRAEWSSPLVGGAATLMGQHFDQLGWASDAEAWEPMARLTAKPAYQAAMADALGDVIRLANTQAIAAGHPDVDLDAAARLVKEDSTGIQLRAARDALVNHDRRMRRRDALTEMSPQDVFAQVSLLDGWASASQQQIITSSASIGGSPMDEEATRAVYAAKGRAVVAFLMLDAMKWQETPELAKLRNTAMAAWRDVAKFHPLVVFNGDPDGSLFGNHPAAMSFQIARAETATQAFEAAVKAIVPAAAPAVKPTIGAGSPIGAAP